VRSRCATIHSVVFFVSVASFGPAASLPARAIMAGWPWVIIGAIPFLAMPRRMRSATSVAGATGIGVAWVLLFCLTGDRRLFFPYTIQVAVQTICLLHGRVRRPALLGGGLAVGLFAAIRVIQGATPAVLAVELLVAGVVLALATAVWRRSSQTPAFRCAISLAGSLLAFAALSL
jgi:hypothetical protein